MDNRMAIGAHRNKVFNRIHLVILANLIKWLQMMNFNMILADFSVKFFKRHTTSFASVAMLFNAGRTRLGVSLISIDCYLALRSFWVRGIFINLFW